MQMTGLTQLIDKISTYRNEVIRLQKAMTAIPALAPENGGQGEKAKADFIDQCLEEVGLNEIEHINAPDDRVSCGYRPNLFVRFPGKSHDKTVWIMSHMDIVPPGDLSLWETDPYEVVEKDGKLYGRGVEDNQQAIVSSLLTVKAFRETSIQPEFDLGLCSPHLKNNANTLFCIQGSSADNHLSGSNTGHGHQHLQLEGS